jgi:uncharacterized membrane protein HdeD (DUF308 family)
MGGISRFRSFLYFEAVLFVLLGAIAIAVPQFLTLGVEMLVGALFLAAGVVQLFRLFDGQESLGFWSQLFSAILNLVLGGLLLFYPGAGILSLTYLLILYFILDGLTKLYYSFQVKPRTNWGWILVSGLLSLVLAGIIFSGLPGTATWVIGLLLGINMIFFGISLASLASALPKPS